MYFYKKSEEMNLLLDRVSYKMRMQQDLFGCRLNNDISKSLK